MGDANVELAQFRMERAQRDEQMYNIVDWTPFGRQQRHEQTLQAEIDYLKTKAQSENRPPNGQENERIEVLMQEIERGRHGLVEQSPIGDPNTKQRLNDDVHEEELQNRAAYEAQVQQMREQQE